MLSAIFCVLCSKYKILVKRKITSIKKRAIGTQSLECPEYIGCLQYTENFSEIFSANINSHKIFSRVLKNIP